MLSRPTRAAGLIPWMENDDQTNAPDLPTSSTDVCYYSRLMRAGVGESFNLLSLSPIVMVRASLLFSLFSLSTMASMTMAALSSSADAPNKLLLSCFEFHENYWLMGFAFHTVSIEFKDDCLRHCLTSQMRGGESCRSAMHIPNDQECVLAEQSHSDRPDLFVENDQRAFFSVNYYENKCADAPVKGGQISAKLEGFKSGAGIVKMAQDITSKQAYVLAVLTDLEANEHYTIHYKNTGEVASGCSNIVGRQGAELDDSTTILMELTTDHTGMAVRPWEQLAT
uniref:Apple domain-containing protein n=1 Tax=Plectus sambesii TaxID=2011161 RepID=A0A914VJZ5_9BILA